MLLEDQWVESISVPSCLVELGWHSRRWWTNVVAGGWKWPLSFPQRSPKLIFKGKQTYP